MAKHKIKPLRVRILTLFPELIEPNFEQSILKRAQQKGLFDPKLINIRDYARNKHRTVDDKPYGGGSGMVMQIGPVARAIHAIKRESDEKIYLLSPTGRRFDQSMARQLADSRSFTLVCGRYEGMDQRIHDHLIDEEISIGDYVLTGGEPAAVVIVDAVARFIPNVLGDERSSRQDSFSDGLLDYPQYTRPVQYRHWKVPELLLSGHHQKITAWRRQAQIERTWAMRPDLLDQAFLTEKEKEYLHQLQTKHANRKGKGRRKP